MAKKAIQWRDSRAYRLYVAMKKDDNDRWREEARDAWQSAVECDLDEPSEDAREDLAQQILDQVASDCGALYDSGLAEEFLRTIDLEEVADGFLRSIRQYRSLPVAESIVTAELVEETPLDAELVEEPRLGQSPEEFDRFVDDVLRREDS